MAIDDENIFEEPVPAKDDNFGARLHHSRLGSFFAPIAQLNRATGFEPEGCGFESY